MTFPFHYRDNGEPCPWSGAPGWTEGQTCSNGCEGAKVHYANDGHAECSDQMEFADVCEMEPATQIPR